LFAGLLVDARDGGSLTYRHKTGRPSGLIPLDAAQGRVKVGKLPGPEFETAVLSRLIELKAADICPHGSDAAGESKSCGATGRGKQPSGTLVGEDGRSRHRGYRRGEVAELHTRRRRWPQSKRKPAGTASHSPSRGASSAA